MIKHLSRLIVIFGWVVGISVTSAQTENNSPRFADGVFLIPAKTVSADGNFAAGVRLDEENDEMTVQLWDLRLAETVEGLQIPDPIQTLILPDEPGEVMLSLELLAFSQDERFLALRQDHGLWVLNVPDLTTAHFIPLIAGPSVLPEQLVWSPDGELVAFEVGSTLTLLEIESGNIYEQGILSGAITPLPDGWIIRAQIVSDRRFPNPFASCTRLLEQCELYDYEGITPTEGYADTIHVSPDGAYVLVHWSLDYVVDTWIWRRQEGIIYIRDDTPIEIFHELRVGAISPNGQYIATYENIGIVEYYRFTLWNFDDLQVIQSDDRGCPPTFFPENDRYFILNCGAMLEIYEIGNEVPLSTINIEDFIEFENPDDYPVTELDTIIYWDLPEIDEINLAGNRVLFRFGNGWVVIPIIRSE